MQSLQMLTNIFKHFDDPIYIVDKNRKILFFNDAAEKITGFSKNEVVNTTCYNNLLNHIDELGNQLCISKCPLVDSIRDNKVRNFFVYLHHKNGHRIPVYIKTIPYVVNNKTIGAIEIFKTNIDRNLNTQYDFLENNFSMVDPLTGLLNRNFLQFNLLKTIKENKGNYFLLFIDLDDFKNVNDTYGHLFGDKVLSAVSNTLINNTSANDYIIRFGGEEFLLFLNVENFDSAYQKSEKLRLLISRSKIREINYSPKASIGLVMFDFEKSLNDNIYKADLAMYEAKKKGKNQTVIFK